HALAEPERVKDAVEFFPVGFPRREQVLERRTQQPRLGRLAGRHHFRRILAFGKAHGESAVAQGFEKRGEPGRDKARDLVEFFVNGTGAAIAHATFPNRRPLVSRVTRDWSSWVLSRHIRVSWTVSGASWRSRTSRPTNA